MNFQEILSNLDFKISYEKFIDWKKLTPQKGYGTQLRDKLIELIKNSATEDKFVLYCLWNTNGTLKYIPTQYKDIQKMLSENNKVFEILFHHCEKLYFDIELVSDIDPLDRCLEELNEYFPGDKVIVSRHRNTEEGFRYSYHIIYNNITIDYTDIDKIVLFCEKCKCLGFDPSVYDYPKNFNAVNQSKFFGNTSKYNVYEIFEYPIEEVLDTVITQPHHLQRINWNSIDTSNWFIKPKDENNITPKEHSQMQKQSYKINLFSIPQQNLPIPNEYSNYKWTDYQPRDILKLLPNVPRGNSSVLSHNIHFQVCNFCVHNNINFNEYWNWAKQKDDNLIRKCNHNQMYEYCESKKDIYKPVYKSLFYLLERFYPEIMKNKEQNEWKQSFFHDKVHQTNDYWYCADDINSKTKITALVGNMGSNKTGSVVDYTHKNENESCLFLAHNRALTQNILTRLNEKKIIQQKTLTGRIITEMKDKSKRNKFVLYSNLKIKKEDKISEFNKYSHFVCCMPSLMYVERTYDIVVIDEVESFLMFLKTDDCFMDYTKSMVSFLNILLNAKKIIILDAFLSQLSKDFFSQFGEIEIVQTKKRYGTREIKLYHNNDNDFINKILELLNQNKNVFCFYPFKKPNSSFYGIECVAEIIRKQGFSVIAHHADDDHNLSQVNELWSNHNLVLTNSKITVGVNFDIPDYFDEVIICPASFNSLRDLFQVSMRIRHLNSKNITFYLLNDNFFDSDFTNHSFAKTIEELPEYKNTLLKLKNNWYIEHIEVHNIENYKFFAELAGFDYNNIEITQDDIKKIDTEITQLESIYDFDYDYVPDLKEDELDEIEHFIKTGQSLFSQRISYRKYLVNNFFPELAEENWINKKDIFNKDLYFNDLKKLNKIKKNEKMNVIYPDLDFVKSILTELQLKKKGKELPLLWVPSDLQMNYIVKAYPSLRFDKYEYKNPNLLLFKLIESDFGFKINYYKDNRKENSEIMAKISMNRKILLELINICDNYMKNC
jgi:hypothetical protein